jgi:hypothetical protein
VEIRDCTHAGFRFWSGCHQASEDLFVEAPFANGIETILQAFWNDLPGAINSNFIQARKPTDREPDP